MIWPSVISFFDQRLGLLVTLVSRGVGRPCVGAEAFLCEGLLPAWPARGRTQVWGCAPSVPKATKDRNRGSRGRARPATARTRVRARNNLSHLLPLPGRHPFQGRRKCFGFNLNPTPTYGPPQAVPLPLCGLARSKAARDAGPIRSQRSR